jgi:SAM-dependent methyltransferase
MEQASIREDVFQEIARLLARHDYYLRMHEHRFRIIIRAVGPPAADGPSRILDVGCWPGYLSMYLKKMGWDVDAIDLKVDRIGDVVESGVRVLERNLNHEPALPYPDAFFRCIVFTEILEHLDPKVAGNLFQEFFRILQPGGRLVITTPNRFSLNKANLNPFRSTAPQVDEEGHGHWLEYRLPEITRLAARTGFSLPLARRISFYAHLGRSDREGYFPLGEWLSHGNRPRNAIKHLLRVPRMLPWLKDSLLCIAERPPASC